MGREGASERGDGVLLRPVRQVLAQQVERDAQDGSTVLRRKAPPHHLGVRLGGRVGVAQAAAAAEDVGIVGTAGGMVAIRVVVADRGRLGHQHVDRDARQAVLAPVGARLRQVVAVDFEQHHVAAAGLRHHMGLEITVDGQLVHGDAVQPLEVAGGETRQRELVPFEILRYREGQGGNGLQFPTVQQFDPQVDVPVAWDPPGCRRAATRLRLPCLSRRRTSGTPERGAHA